MNNKRRNRPNVARSRSPEFSEGIYNNQPFLNCTAGFVGTNVIIDTTDGSRYGGVFTGFSSQFEIALEFAHVIHLSESSDKTEQRKHLQRLIFHSQNIVNMEIKNVDPTFASRDGSFQTDACISKFDRNGQSSGEKELQPWVGDCNGEEIELSLGTEPGWDADAMFKLNEEVYGVRSSFDNSLAGYTTPLERSESKGFKDAEARAVRIAKEIERSPKTLARLEVENGDEEECFAAVARPTEDRNSPPRSGDKGKYIPPVRRQGGSFHGRLTARTAPFPLGRSPSTPSAEEAQESSVHENSSPTAPTSNCEDNRNNNSCSPSAAASTVNAPHSSHAHTRSNNNGSRGKPYMVQGYSYSQPPRYPAAGHPPMVQQRPLPPSNVASQPPPSLQHGPPPQQIPMVYPQPLPPNPPHQNALPPVSSMPQDTVSQTVPAPPTNHTPNQSVTIMHGMEQANLQHVHLPPHSVPHVHQVVPAGYVPTQRDPREPRDHDMDLRGHRGVNVRGQAPRVFQPNNKRFPQPFQTPPPPRKTRSEEVSELAEFSTNLKLAGESEEPEEKHESPPLEPWGKGRSPPSNSSAEDPSSALKKSTLNPNAKEFVYNPSAKPFTPRPPNTPGPSRPHTPQTPAQPFGYSPGPMPTVLMPTYVMQPSFSHQAQPPRLQMAPRPEISSQMQVAAATGQPLLAPAPLQRFMAPYPNPPPQPYQQVVRMVQGQAPVMFHPEGAPHVQYMSPHGQPHPSGQFQQAQPQQFPATMVYSVPLTQTAMMQYFQPQQPVPGQQPHVQVIVPNQ